MSKKYDNNLQEIKETRTFATNTTIDSRNLGTLGVYFERDVLTKKVEELKQQLAEKDKEIERLKSVIDEMVNKVSNANQNFNKTFRLIEKQLRHQICEEIRAEAIECWNTIPCDIMPSHRVELKNFTGLTVGISCHDFEDILNQIEKGE